MTLLVGRRLSRVVEASVGLLVRQRRREQAPRNQQVSHRNRSHCRPGTGAASTTRHRPTGANVTSIYRDRTGDTSEMTAL